MVDAIRLKSKNLLKKIKLIKINFLNHKFKKYIIKYEERGNELKIINSNGDYKIVENTILNKVKVMEIIKNHKVEIEEKIDYYENNKNDFKLILLLSEILLLFLGSLFILSFFLGSYVFYISLLLIFTSSLIAYLYNLYNFLLFRLEVKRLVDLNYSYDNLDQKSNNIMVFKSVKILFKSYIYGFLSRIVSIFDNKSKI